MQELLTRAGCFIGIIVMGILLKRIGFFRDEDFTVVSRITIRITLPCAIITNFAGKQIDPAMLAIAAVGLGTGLVYIGLGSLLNLRGSKEQRAFEILNLPGYNIGTFTLPFAQSFLGPTGVIVTSIFDTGNAAVCLGGAYGVAAMVKEGKGFSVMRVVRALSRSVPFVCYITLLALNLLHVPIPAPVVSFAGIIGNANAFMAMLMVGIGFKLSGDLSKIGKIVKILSVRYGVAVVFALGCYFLLPFSQEIRQALVIVVFSPIGSAVPGFTSELKGDVGLSSAINSISLIISIVIMVTLLSVML